MGPSKKLPTIQDVARHAGVSTATVSRALSHPQRVSEGTRARVSLAIDVTGYTLNQAARSLRQKSARTLLVALPDIRNPFFSSILDAVEREAAGRGYGILVANLYFGHETVRRLQELLLSNRADGLLLLDGSVNPEHLRMLTREPVSIPLVFACEEVPNLGFHTVLTDNALSAERATRHLIDLGHRDIGHIMGPEHNSVAKDRMCGFTRAIEAARLQLNPNWLFRGNFEMESGFAAAARYMALDHRPTAIFAANDESAIGLLSGLRQHGIACPQDISVVGFDDLEVAPHYWPPLTTIRQPRETLGRMATETLIDLIEGNGRSSTPLRIILSSELVVRGSTASPARRDLAAALDRAI